MDILSLDPYLHGSGVKGLILHFAPGSAVDGVSHVSAPALYIKEIHAVSYFLIRRKSDLYRAVRNFRMSQKRFRHGHDLSDTRLVVRAQKRGSVGGDQVFSHIFFQIREQLRRHGDPQRLI